MKKFHWLIAVILLQTACKKEKEPEVIDQTARFIQNYSNIVYANYLDAKTAESELESALILFCNQTTDQNFIAAKNAWKACRPFYLQTEAYRMYGGPIDDDNGPEGRLNGWPMDEAYVDYVQGNDSAGIINNPILYPDITKEKIEEWNELNGETNISSGYHGIEFLLWGQDLNVVSGTAGQRPFTDYIVSASGPGKYAERRKTYLLACSNVIQDDLSYVIEQWKPDTDNFRKSFNVNPQSSLLKILQGLINFSGTELAGERIQVALNTQNQEDEHSCFSDNTHIDHLHDLIGIRNIYLGDYLKKDGTTIKGVGLSDLIRAKNSTLDSEIKTLINEIKTLLESYQTPFDEAILNTSERTKIQSAVDKLLVLKTKFQQAYDLLN